MSKTYRQKCEQKQFDFWPQIETITDNKVIAQISNEPRRHVSKSKFFKITHENIYSDFVKYTKDL